MTPPLRTRRAAGATGAVRVAGAVLLSEQHGMREQHVVKRRLQRVPSGPDFDGS